MNSLFLLPASINDRQNLDWICGSDLEIVAPLIWRQGVTDFDRAVSPESHEINRHDPNIRYRIMVDKPQIKRYLLLRQHGRST